MARPRYDIQCNCWWSSRLINRTNFLMLLMFLFTIKHCIADIFLQTYHKHVDKSKYFGTGHRHYAEHGACTFILLLFFTNPIMALALGFLDYVIHWHIDWAKTTFCKNFEIQRNTPTFWRIHTLDQIAHFSTYFYITCLLQ